MIEPNFQIVLENAPYHEVLRTFHTLEEQYPQYTWAQGTATKGSSIGSLALLATLRHSVPYPITGDVFEYFRKHPREYRVSIFCCWGKNADFMEATLNPL